MWVWKSFGGSLMQSPAPTIKPEIILAVAFFRETWNMYGVKKRNGHETAESHEFT